MRKPFQNYNLTHNPNRASRPSIQNKWLLSIRPWRAKISWSNLFKANLRSPRAPPNLRWASWTKLIELLMSSSLKQSLPWLRAWKVHLANRQRIRNLLRVYLRQQKLSKTLFLGSPSLSNPTRQRWQKSRKQSRLLWLTMPPKKTKPLLLCKSKKKRLRQTLRISKNP